MNIVMIGDSFYPDTSGGSHRVIYEEAKEFCSLGDSVYVLTPRRTGLPIEEIIDGIHVIRYPKRKGFLGFVDYFFNPNKLLRKLQKKVNFNVIYCHWALSNYLIFKRHMKDIKKVFLFHGPSFLEYKIELSSKKKLFSKLFVKIIKTIEKRTIQLSDSIIVASDYMKNVLIESFSPRCPIFKIDLACDTAKFQIPKSKNVVQELIGFNKDQFNLLTIRRIKKRMGIDLIIKAMPQIIKSIPNVHLYIGGEGSYKEELMKLSNSFGLNSYISFVGFISDSNISNYYGAADIFIVPSVSLEGFGLVTLEALSCGTPVVGTSVDANIYVIGNYCKKLLSLPNNSSDLAQKIISLYKDYASFPPERQRNYVLSNYSWKKTVAETRLIFNQI